MTVGLVEPDLRLGREFTLRRKVEKFADDFFANAGEMQLLERLETAVTLARSLPFEVDLTRIQGGCYSMMRTVYPVIRKKAEDGEEWATEWAGRARAVAAALLVRVP